MGNVSNFYPLTIAVIHPQILAPPLANALSPHKIELGLHCSNFWRGKHRSVHCDFCSLRIFHKSVPQRKFLIYTHNATSIRLKGRRKLEAVSLDRGQRTERTNRQSRNPDFHVDLGILRSPLKQPSLLLHLLHLLQLVLQPAVQSVSTTEVKRIFIPPPFLSPPLRHRQSPLNAL